MACARSASFEGRGVDAASLAGVECVGDGSAGVVGVDGGSDAAALGLGVTDSLVDAGGETTAASVPVWL